MTVPKILQRAYATAMAKIGIVLANDGGANDGNAVEMTGTSTGSVNVNITGGMGTITAAVTNDGTFAKETGGNLATLTTTAAQLATDAHLTAFSSDNHTDLAAILAKQPASPALESGHLATIDTSTATTATQTTTTATNTGTLAGAVAASGATMPANVVVEGGVGQNTAPSAVSAGKLVAAWRSLIGTTMVALTDAAGATVAAIKPASTAAVFNDGAATVDVRPGGVFPAGTVPADAEANSGAIATMSRILSRLQGYNGTTWDMLRAGLTAAGTPTGWLNTLAGLVYLSSPPTLTNGQGSPLLGDSKANLLSSLGTLLFGEDPAGTGATVTGRLATCPQYTATHISTATTTTAVSGAGVVGYIVCNSLTVTGTMTVYDSLTGSGTVRAVIAVPVPGSAYCIGMKFATGLTLVTATAASDWTVLTSP